MFRRILDAVRRDTRPFVEALERQPWWPQLRDSVVALRPAWWLARAWVAWWVLRFGDFKLLPGGLGTLLLLLLCVGVSVALGRGLLDRRLHLDRPWAPVLLTTLNVFAAVLLLPALSTVSGARSVYVSDPVAQQSGLSLDGEPVRNVFAYDAQGRPIPLVQLYDQNGRPLDVAHEPYTDAFDQQQYTDPDGSPVAPFVDDRSRNRWNVFPLPAASYPDPAYGDDGLPTATASPVVTQPPAPLVAVPPIAGILGFPSSAPTGTQTSTPTPAPSSSPAASSTAASRTPSATRS